MFSAAFGTGIFLSFQMIKNWVIWVIFLTGVIIFFVWSALKDRGLLRRTVCLTLCFAAAGGSLFSISQIKADYSMELYGDTIYKKGIVRQAEKKSGYYSFIIDDGKESFLVRYYGNIEGITAYTGQQIAVSGKTSEIQGRRNPGCFDYNLYIRSCGIDAVIDAGTVEIVPGKTVPLLRITAHIRKKFENRLSQEVDDITKGLIMAIMFGDKEGLDEGLQEEFRGTGTAHVLAVSGLHVGILYGFFSALWKWKKGSCFYLITMAVLLLYTALADFSPSVVRAAIMIIIHAAAGIMRRRYDLLSAAAVTFFIMLVYEPFQLFNTGFQLSFMAIVSVGMIMPYIEKTYDGVFLTAVAVQTGMMPYTAFVFNYVSAGAIAANIPVVFIAGILLPVGLCLLAAMMLPETVFDFFALVMQIGCDVLIWINSMFYADGITSFDVRSPSPWMLVIYYGVMIFFFSETGQLMRRRVQKKRLCAVFIAILVVAAGVGSAAEDGFRNVEITFVDVGQGDCIHIQAGRGMNYLIDGGGSENYDVGMKVLKPYLLKNGVRKIDAAFVTHLHEDHYGGIRSLASDGMIEKIGVYDANRIIEKQLEEESGAELFYLYEGQRIKLSEDVFLEVISPERKSEREYENLLSNEEDENEASLIFMLVYKSVKILLTGDIDSEGEKELIRDHGGRLECDVLKAPHHGSRYSSSEEFVAAADPQIAVFQVGKNNYGHPDEEVLAQYRNIGTEIFRNDLDGAVGIDINSRGQIKVVKMID